MEAFDTTTEGTLVSLAMELQALDSETFEIQDYAEFDGLMGAPAGKQGGNGNHATSTSSTSTCSTCSTTSCCA
ncbi:thiazolylpeptide-type bacteriocin [Catenulispora rubra]|uniref:thiazolylpeptide-type bacteriocin n=1 Tax=Catenulispora rubra TaxID=280293 RepID=UPI00189280F6|nr:thiazolylpeptide-type bacteriocin [Catenulispora rubra]